MRTPKFGTHRARVMRATYREEDGKHAVEIAFTSDRYENEPKRPDGDISMTFTFDEAELPLVEMFAKCAGIHRNLPSKATRESLEEWAASIVGVSVIMVLTRKKTGRLGIQFEPTAETKLRQALEEP